MKVYLAHPMRFYNTPIIDKVSEALKNVFGDVDIIDPSDHGWKCDQENSIVDVMNNMEHVFFPLIEYSDVVVAVKNTDLDRYTPGVALEVEYAKETGKKLIVLSMLLTPMNIDIITVDQITYMINGVI